MRKDIIEPLLLSAAFATSATQNEVCRLDNNQGAPGDRKRRKQRNKKNRTARASRKRNRR